MLIRNGRVFDGVDGSLSEPGRSVSVEGDRIAWIGPDADAPHDDVVIDAGGRALLPGLIDGHVHLAHDGIGDLATQAREDTHTIASLRAARNARLTLHSGVTTVKDLGAVDNIVIDLNHAIEQGIVPGPRIVAAGRVITMTGGHGHFIGVEADGVDAVRSATRGQLKLGAGTIKAMATGGVLTVEVKPTQSALLRAELEAIVEEAHHAGRRVSTHAIGREGIENSILAGVDTIEHGFYLDEELFALAIEHGTFLVPTLSAVSGIVNGGAHGECAPEWILRKAEVEFDRSREMFRNAVESGMRIAAGTDAGTPFNPHDQLVNEMIEMVRIGLSTSRTLLSATRDGAENTGMSESIGTLEPGKYADLIMVDGNPLERIEALRDLVFVMKGGTVYRDEFGAYGPRGLLGG